jgi:hypothetical protein
MKNQTTFNEQTRMLKIKGQVDRTSYFRAPCERSVGGDVDTLCGGGDIGGSESTSVMTGST